MFRPVKQNWLIAFALVAMASVTAANPALPPAERLSIKVIEVLPHDRQAFTQGLLFHEGKLYESTGLRGKSSLRRVEPTTGKVEKIHRLPKHLFGEGLERLGDRLYQLTWEAGIGLIYDLKSFEKLGEFAYDGEGWGLTTDGTHLIISDGTSRLRFVNPETFEVVKTLTVRHKGRPVIDINELEWVDGQIFANLWYRHEIIRISPHSGLVTGILPTRGILKPRPLNKDDVLNGIAYDEATGDLYLTGKNWPNLFRVRLQAP